jgi:hypothetical protein
MKSMKSFNQYMLFYTGLQMIGVVGIIKIRDWEESNREKMNKNDLNKK